MKVLKVLSRIYLSPDMLDQTVSFYETTFGEPCPLRFEYPEMGLELAQIGSVLLIAGSEEKLHVVRSTHLTFLVDSIEEFVQSLPQKGAEIIRPLKKVPTGYIW